MTNHRRHAALAALLLTAGMTLSACTVLESALPPDERRCVAGERLREDLKDTPEKSLELKHQSRIQSSLKSKGWGVRVEVDDDNVYIAYVVGNEAKTLRDLCRDIGEAVSEGGDWGDCANKKVGGMNLPGWPEGSVIIAFPMREFSTKIPNTYDKKYENVKESWPHLRDEELDRQMTEL